MENNNSVVQDLFLGMLRDAIEVTLVNVFLMGIDIPTMSTASLKKRQTAVGPAVEKAAKKTYVNSTAAERPCKQNFFDEQN